eukprot:2898628-Prorocentrum_lima.AAC.1
MAHVLWCSSAVVVVLEQILLTLLSTSGCSWQIMALKSSSSTAESSLVLRSGRDVLPSRFP